MTDINQKALMDIEELNKKRDEIRSYNEALEEELECSKDSLELLVNHKSNMLEYTIKQVHITFSRSSEARVMEK